MLDYATDSKQDLLPIEVSRQTKNRIMESLREEFPPSTTLIRDNMRRDLGFVFREHRQPGERYWNVKIYVDFFADSARSWFLIRFAEVLDR